MLHLQTEEKFRVDYNEHNIIDKYYKQDNIAQLIVNN